MTAALAMPDPAVLIAGMVFAVMVIDPDHGIAQVNPVAEELFGRSEARLRGRPVAAFARFEEPRISALLADPEAQFVARDLTRLARADLLGNRAGRA